MLGNIKFTRFKDKVKRVIVLIVVIKLDNVLVVELVHDFDFELNLFYKIIGLTQYETVIMY